MHAVRPSPGRNTLTGATNAAMRREHAFGIVRHLAHCGSSVRARSIRRAGVLSMAGIRHLVVGVELCTASACGSCWLRCARRHKQKLRQCPRAQKCM